MYVGSLRCSPGQWPHLGFVAASEDTAAEGCMTLDRLKSATLACQCLSTKRLADFKSLCKTGGCLVCK